MLDLTDVSCCFRLQQQWTYIDQLTSQLVPKCRYASSLMGWSNDDMLQQLSYQRLQHALAEYADSSKVSG